MIKEVIIKEKGKNDDEFLINDFVDGNSGSFDRLVVKYRDMIFNVCLKVTGDYDTANDCAQETFIKMYNNLHTFKFKSSLSTWLYRVALNTCRNRVTSKDYRFFKKAMRINKSENEDEDSFTRDIGDTSFNPEAVYEEKEGYNVILDAISKLPVEQKEVVVLRDIEGKTYDEIVEITGYKLGTVKSKLARARQDLRKKLGGIFDGM
jgi:RNA polymerase sigma-70 factor (ECF subfamily)